MHCQQANDLFSDYVERILDPALTVSVDNHLAACPSCREMAAGMRYVWTQLDRLPVQDPPLVLHANIASALDTHLAAEAHNAVALRNSGQRWDWRLLFRPRTLAYAATLLILVLGSLEVVQTKRATLGPLGMIVQAISSRLHSQPGVIVSNTMVTSTNSTWTANPTGGGVLMVHLKATSSRTSSQMGMYQADLTADSAAAMHGHSVSVLASAQGRFAANGEATVALSLERDLPNNNVALLVTLDPAPSNDSGTGLASHFVVPLKTAGIK